MTNKKPSHRQPPDPPTAPARPTLLANILFFGTMAIVGGIAGYVGWQYFHPDAAPTPPVAANPEPTAKPPTPTAQSPTPPVPANPQSLRGNWIRSDGGYVLAIMKVADDGKLQAAYLNPNPINVAKAEATKVDGGLRVFVELRDVNYPGSTYDLRYNAASDQLVGEYFLAGQLQRFPVQFDRQ